jgi:NAD(P)H-dependent FMN reductase
MEEMTSTPVVLLLSGSLRAGSSNEAVLRTVQAIAPGLVQTVFYDRLAALPHFNPDADTDPPPAEAARLRAAIAGATAVLICAPEYAGTLPGTFKNLLDWTVGDTEISGKPIAWVNVAAAGQGGAEATLRTVLTHTGADIVESACARIPVERRMVGCDGMIADPEVREQLSEVLRRLTEASIQE